MVFFERGEITDTESKKEEDRRRLMPWERIEVLKKRTVEVDKASQKEAIGRKDMLKLVIF